MAQPHRRGLCLRRGDSRRLLAVGYAIRLSIDVRLWAAGPAPGVYAGQPQVNSTRNNVPSSTAMTLTFAPIGQSGPVTRQELSPDTNAAVAMNDRFIEKEIRANHRVRPALGERTGARAA
jgi:hypothetical protein